jgi:BNR/Asp-box repeat
VRAALFLGPLFIGGAIFGTAAVLVVSGGGRALTARRALDRSIVQFASLVVVLAGIGVAVAGAGAASSSQSGEGVVVTRGAVVLLGLGLVATGITVMVQPQWRSGRLAGAALAVLAVLSVAATMAGPASATAQTSLIGTSGTLVGSGFWTATPRAKTGAVQFYAAASCPAPTYCIASGQPPFGGFVWTVSNDGGATWRAVSAHTEASPFNFDSSTPYSSVSCWDSSSCLAEDSLTTPVLTSDGGRHWSNIRGQLFASGNLALQADCFSPGRCLLAGFFRERGQTATPLLVTHDGGGHWVKPQLPRGSWSVATVGCPSADVCMALASTGVAQTAAVLSSTDGGLTWQRLAAPGSGLVTTYSSSYIACTGTKACLLSSLWAPKATRAEPYPPAKFATYVTTDGGRKWVLSTFPILPRGQRLEYMGAPMVACSARLCMAYRSPGLYSGPIYSPVLLSTDLGEEWTVDRHTLSLAQVAGGSNVRELTCDAGSLCLAVGESSNGSGIIFYSHDGGVTWATAHGARGGPPWA